MTYLQYQTIVPLQEQLEKEIKVLPVISLRQAVAKKFTKNYIGELTPSNGKMINRPTRGDSTSDQSQQLQKTQSKPQNQEELHEPNSNQRSDKLIKIPDSLTPYSEYYNPSTNTIRLPQQIDDIQYLRKQRTPKSIHNKQQQQS